MPRQRPVGRQTPLRPHPQRLEVARLDAGRSSARRRPQQGRLPRRPIPATTAPPRPQESARRRQALDHLRLLAHAHNRRALPRPRRRLLPQTRPRTRYQTPRATARGARTLRNPPTGGGSLSRIFLSEGEYWPVVAGGRTSLAGGDRASLFDHVGDTPSDCWLWWRLAAMRIRVDDPAVRGRA